MLILCVKAITSLAMTYRRHPNSSSLSSGFSSSCFIASLHLVSLVFVEGSCLHISLCSSYNVLYKLFFFSKFIEKKDSCPNRSQRPHLERGLTNFPISRNHLKILGGRRVKESEFPIQNPHILGVFVQALVVWATRICILLVEGDSLRISCGFTYVKIE
jgi:hypothetical protein